MTSLPDAPWIRDAELNGIPEDPPCRCPVCGEECETYYFTYERGVRGDVIGCENCIRELAAADCQD